ncbi:MAG: hypothetical protein AAB840_00450 [Patescibacteria group bacterium]
MRRKILRGFLIFGGIFLFFEALLHFSNVKLIDVGRTWPDSAKSFASFMSQLYGSFALLVGILAFLLQVNIEKYKVLILATGVWAFLHGLFLLLLSLSQNFLEKFSGLPSLYIWSDFYNQYLLIEALLLFTYSVIVYIWSIDKSHD